MLVRFIGFGIIFVWIVIVNWGYYENYWYIIQPTLKAALHLLCS